MGLIAVATRWIEHHNEIKAVLFLPVLLLAFWQYLRVSSSERQMDYISIMAVAAHFLVLAVALKLLSLSPVQHSDGKPRRRIRLAMTCRRSLRVFLYNKRKNFFRSSFGDAIDFVIIVMAVAACCMYVVETYFPSLLARWGWQALELALSVFFCADHVMRLIVSTDPVVYLVSFQGIINVVTFLPVMIYVLYRFLSGNVDGNFYGSSLSYLRLLRLAKLLRILRGLNIIRSAPSDNLRMELFTLVFTVICMVFTAAGLFHWLENEDSCSSIDIHNVFDSPLYSTGDTSECLYFHMALYLCTIEVLGRPRLIFQRPWTVCMVIGLVALSVVVIPAKLAGVLQVMQRTNKYQRMYYVPSSWWSKHLVVVGHKDFGAINMFLYEFFHNERGHHVVQDVVLLFAGPPSSDLEALLCHPLYSGTVTYIQGTPLQEKDLERACLIRAAGVIVMANKDAESSMWHDGELVTCIQSMKSFWLKEVVRQSELAIVGSQAAAKLLRPRIVAQVMLPRTKAYLKALPGWTDNDVVIVCSEYISEMLSMATLARGMASLVFNLVSHIDMQPKYRTKWYKRYEDGASQEIYTAKVEGAFVGLSMTDAATLLAKEGCLLIGAKSISGERGGEDYVVPLHLFPGPSDFELEPGDRMFCIAKSAPQLNSVVASLSGRKEKEADKLAGLDNGVESSLLPGFIQSMNSESIRQTVERIEHQVEEVVDDIRRHRNGSRKSLPGSDPDEPSNRRANSSVDLYLLEHPQLAEACVAHSSRRKTMEMGKALSRGNVYASQQKEDRWLKPADISARIREREPVWSDHVVLIGMPFCHEEFRAVGYGAVTAFIQLLQEADVNQSAGQPRGIVIVDENAEKHLLCICETDAYLMKMVQQRRIRAVTGDPRHQDTLIQFAMVGTARSIVTVPEDVCKAMKRSLFSVDSRSSDSSRLKLVKQIVDTNTVLTMQMAKEYAVLIQQTAKSLLGDNLVPSSPALSDKAEFIQPAQHTVTLLLQESTTNLFFGHAHMRHVGAANPANDVTPVNMSPLFAAGEIIATSCADRILAEAFFNKHLLQLITVLFHGDSSKHRLRQISCPPELEGKDFVDALQELLCTGQMLLGILRSPDLHTGETFFYGERCEMPNLPDTMLPYVVTNPPRGDILLQAADLLFLVGSRSDVLESVPSSEHDVPYTSERDLLDAPDTSSWRRHTLEKTEVLSI